MKKFLFLILIMAAAIFAWLWFTSEDGVDDAQATAQTVEVMDNVASKQYDWLLDNVGYDLFEEAGANPSSTPLDFRFGNGDGEMSDRRLYRVSHDVMVNALVGTPEKLAQLQRDFLYIESVPEKDGWGHNLEFYVYKGPAMDNGPFFVIRSPGNDGVFSTPPNYIEADVTADGYRFDDFGDDIVRTEKGFYVPSNAATR